MLNLTESSSGLKSAGGTRWRAILITPGQGSSGYYSEEVLKEYGPKAFRANHHSYVDHPDKENPTRSPKNLMGVLAKDAWYEEGVGLVGEIEVFPHWKEFVEAVAPHTGLSIYAGGEKDEDENITELYDSPQNSVDLVSYAGRGGSLAEKLYESAVSAFALNETSAEAVDVKKKNERKSQMEIEDLAKEVSEQKEQISALISAVTSLTESIKPVEEPSDPTAAVKAAYEKAIEAGLPKRFRDAVIAKVEADAEADVDALIESEKKAIEEIKSELAESLSDGYTVDINITENATDLGKVFD